MDKTFYFCILMTLLVMAGCKNASVNTKQMAGTMDEPVPSDTVPENVRLAMDKADRYHSHELLSDPENDIAVSAIDALTYSDSPGRDFNRGLRHHGVEECHIGYLPLYPPQPSAGGKV